ncbi:NRPS cluster protein [Microsporum canis]
MAPQVPTGGCLSSSNDWTVVAIPTQNLSKLRFLDDDNVGLSLPALVQLAWAVVLRTYEGVDEVRFAYQCLTSESFAREGNGRLKEVFVPEARVVSLQGQVTLDALIIKPLTQECDGDGIPAEHGVDSMIQIWGLPDDTRDTEDYARKLAASMPRMHHIYVTAIVSKNYLHIYLSFKLSHWLAALSHHVADAFLQSFNIINECPWTLVSCLDLVSPEALSQVQEWATYAPELDREDHSSYEIIDQQPAEALAIDSWDGKFTYNEISRLSSLLAMELRSYCAVRNGDYIPVCFEKSAWAIIAMLAIHKAGGIYVPVDPACPEKRFEDILSQVQPKLILTSSVQLRRSCLTFLMDSTAVKLMAVDRDLFTRFQDDAPYCHPPPPSNLPAYCIFTSGSTGRPKGVLVEQRALSASLQAHGAVLGLCSTSRVLQNTAYTFDVSVTETFGTLYHGGCICIPEDTVRVQDTAACINQMNINWAFFTPSFSQIIDATSILKLDTLVLGGEAVTEASINQWASPHRRLINAYGPTECSIFSVIGDIDLSRRSARNIGRAVGATAFITDPENPAQLMPIGAPGELLLSGPILARGYLEDTEKTDAAFIQPPPWYKKFLCSKIRSRLYRTGDLVRYCADGTLEYLGRKDRQVKLNGQRLELGEIETAIKRCCPLASAVVDIFHHPLKQQQLVLVALIAFEDTTDKNGLYVLSENKPCEVVDEIQSSLDGHLPRYMIPTFFIPISQIPLSTAGKINRLALRTLALAVIQGDLQKVNTEGSLPQLTETEKVIQSAWSDVLSVSKDKLGLDHKFFRYGDSLAAIKLIRRLKDNQIDMTIMDVFQNPTILQMATKAQALLKQSSKIYQGVSLLSLGDGDIELIREAAGQCHLSENMIQVIYPCSPMQEALMAITLHNPSAYQARYVYRLPQEVDLTRFQEAWRVVVRETPILRTRIISTTQKLMQVVTGVQPHWELERNLDTYLKNSSPTPALYGSELTSFALVEDHLDSTLTFFVWTIHHILYDGHSLPLVLEDVQRVYSNMYRIHRPNFSDFIGNLMAQNGDAGDAFWLNDLNGFATKTFPHITEPEYRAVADQTIVFQSTVRCPFLTDFLPSVLLQGSWALLLSRYVESDDVVFGVTLSGRYGQVEEIEQIIGPTLSTVPLRVRIDRRQSVSNLLGDLQSHLAQVMEFGSVGMQRIRSLSSAAARACEFQSLLVVQPPQSVATEGLFCQERLVLSKEVIAGNALTLEAQLVDDGAMIVNAHFDSTIVTDKQVERILNQWDYVLQQLIIGDPGKPITASAVISTSDILQMIEWNSNTPGIQYSTIHEQVGRRVLQNPHKEALCGWDGSLSYTELWSITDRLATHISALGISHGDLVPLCLEKSSYSIVCMIAVLKAGAAFVPLDVRHPLERLEGIVSQTNARLVITSPKYRQFWLKRQHISIDRKSIEILSQSAEVSSLPSVPPSGLAYVIFTSGTSGQPKGVMIQHQALCTSIGSYCEPLNIHESIRTLQFASYSFDASILEIFSTLIVGGTVCTPSIDECMDSVAQSIQKYESTWALLTPSVVQTLSLSEGTSLQTLVLGGEPITSMAIAMWKDRVKLINAYGPTECSIVCAANHIQSSNDVGVIGKPCGSVHWVVNPDNHDELSLIGEIGELLVEGPIEAMGYLNNPERTATAFIAHPPWRQNIDISPQSARIYKTGDLVHWNENGTLSYVGRKDLQVKVRGQRLELEEIESKISHPSIQERAVIQPRSGPFAKKLVALFTINSPPVEADNELGILSLESRNEVSGILASLRNRLPQELPEYMIPDHWIPLIRMPLTSSAKTNRKSLVEMVERVSEVAHVQINQFNEQPNHSKASSPVSLGPVEETLRKIWSSLLGVPEYSIHGETSFLRIGGDSISAMQLVAKCRSVGLTLSVRNILEHKTLSQVSQCIRFTSKTSQPLSMAWSERLFSPSPIQQMFFDRLSTEKIPMFSQSFLLRMRWDVDPTKIIEAIHVIVTRHPMLRARFSRNSDSAWSQRITDDIKGSYYLKTHKRAIEDEIIPEIMQESRQRLNAISGPVMTGDIFSSSGESWLFLAVHHLVVDLVSWRIILDEVESLLCGSPLAPVSSISFPEWCSRQAEYCATNINLDQTFSIKLPAPNYDYWGMTDKPNTYGMVERLTITIDNVVSSQIISLCANSWRLELSDIFIGALVMAFHREFSDREIPAVFVEHHGREPWVSDIDITETVAWFTTLSPVLGITLEGSSQANFTDILRRTRDCRRQLPANGWEFFSSAFLTAQGKEQFKDSMCPEIIFNYEGIFQQLESSDKLLELTPQVDGDLADMAPDTPRLALLEFAVQIHHGTITISCMYNREMHYTNRIKELVSDYGQIVKQFSDIFRDESPPYSLSDFPFISLTYHGLDELLKSVDGESIEAIYPTLPTQDLMILRQHEFPGLYVPRIAFEIHTTGFPLSSTKVADAWKEIVSHHSILRTVFIDDPISDRRLQVVLTHLEPTIRYVPEMPFICPQNPQWPQGKAHHTLIICEREDKPPSLLLEISHTLVDVRTLNILLGDFTKALEGNLCFATTSSGFTDLISYTFAPSNISCATAFWQSKLVGNKDSCIGLAHLEGEYGDLQKYPVSIEDKIDGGRHLLQNKEVSIPSVIRLAWARTLRRYLESDDVTFAFVLSGRDIDIPHIQDVAGPFLNFVPCRLSFNSSSAGNPPTLEMLQRLDQDYLESIVYQSNASTIPSRPFDTIVNFRKHKADEPDTKAGQMQKAWLEIIDSIDPYHYSMVLEVDSTERQLDATITFWTARVTAELATQFANSFAQEIEAIIDEL